MKFSHRASISKQTNKWWRKKWMLSRTVEWCQPLCTAVNLRRYTYLLFTSTSTSETFLLLPHNTHTFVLSSFFAAIYRRCVFLCFKCVNWLINIGKLMLRPFRSGTLVESVGKVEKNEIGRWGQKEYINICTKLNSRTSLCWCCLHFVSERSNKREKEKNWNPLYIGINVRSIVKQQTLKEKRGSS